MLSLGFTTGAKKSPANFLDSSTINKPRASEALPLGGLAWVGLSIADQGMEPFFLFEAEFDKIDPYA